MTAETTRELIERGERDGFTEGLCYRIARQMHGDDYSVCVRCGWAWAGMNRCLNDACRGFCTWGKAQNEPPTSWLPNGPRPVGVSDEQWRFAWTVEGRPPRR
jgi:hypothetical protein